MGRIVPVVAVAVAAYLVGIGVILPAPPTPTDPGVAMLDIKFAERIAREDSGLSISSKGWLLRDRDTTFWKMFTDKFGANPNTPYMWSALPLIGFLLPSPMWNLGKQDAVVLLARKPPSVEYFSFTTFALFMPRRSAPILPFSSLGDSTNNANIKHDANGLFAHVVTSNKRTFELVTKALLKCGLPESAINLVAVPSKLGLFDDVIHFGGQVRLGTYFEVVLRLFRFHNQTEGDAYLQSAPPVFYLSAEHADERALEASKAPSYADRTHPDNVREAPLAAKFAAHGTDTLAKVSAAFPPVGGAPGGPELTSLTPLEFTPLLIKGLECLEKDTECLGDCPDAAYFGPHVQAESDDIEMLQLRGDDVIHLVTAVNHRQLDAAVYGSIALLKPHPVSSATLSKTRMSVRATSVGVTSFDFNSTANFISWAFTRNAEHCARLERSGAVDGCTVVEESHVPREGFLTYCERVYLNPVTGLGPHWDDLLPARLYHVRLDPSRTRPDPEAFRVPKGLPPPLPLSRIEDGSETMRFFHIIKTGGESLELHLAAPGNLPRLNYSHCRRAATSTGWRANMSAFANPVCAAASAAVSAVLCAANCECCAADARVEGGFNGVLIRSPRSHMLSLFTHCHTAHTQNTWARIFHDFPQYLAEVVLRSTEWSCGTYCGISFLSDWAAALQDALRGDKQQEKALRVLPLHNTQAHALTCSTGAGRSLGQHFRVLDDTSAPGDALLPDIGAALASLRSFDWIGLTDVFEPSVCLLHYQASGTLPKGCDCSDGKRLSIGLPRFNHGVKRHDPKSLDAATLDAIDALTEVDGQVFAEALRLLLGRLATVKERTGTDILQCINWRKLYESTGHIHGLWAAPDALATP